MLVDEPLSLILNLIFSAAIRIMKIDRPGTVWTDSGYAYNADVQDTCQPFAGGQNCGEIVEGGKITNEITSDVEAPESR